MDRQFATLADPYELAPHVRVAVAVLRQALVDATGSGARHTPHRHRARLFLRRDNRDLEFWCHCAGLRVDLLVAYTDRLIRVAHGQIEHDPVEAAGVL